MVIEAAGSGDLPSVLALLERNHLPLDGVAEHLATMVVARQDGRVVGVAALEIYMDGAALLRSVAVDPALHGKGLGHALTDAALDMAEARAITDVWLLTTTAEHFFSKLGFEPIPRDQAPLSVHASVEFTSACPASAIVMRTRLNSR